MKLQVMKVIDHGPDVKELRFARLDQGPLPAWDAGAHVRLRLCLNGKEVERHYSLIGNPGACTDYRIAVLQDPAGRGGSRHIHTHCGVGSKLEVSDPQSTFPLNPSANRYLLVAGGIGITPLISIAHTLLARAVPFELHYLVRSRDRAALLEELFSLVGSRLHLHVSSEGQRVQLAGILGNHSEDLALYACGPRGLLLDLEATAAKLGWPRGSIQMESFGAHGMASDRPLAIELAETGGTIELAPGTSILDALIEAGTFVAYECKRGECSACYTTVLAGQPLHRDLCLTSEQRTKGMCLCVSWASSDKLVLEL